MTDANQAEANQLTIARRTNVSRKLLARKAAERALLANPNELGVEAAFPASPPLVLPESRLRPVIAANLLNATPAPAWSDEDEGTFQAYLVRRKAAGVVRRGKAPADDLVTVGHVAPNPNTVIAVIVAIVSSRGAAMRRNELVSAMTQASFPSVKARPSETGWCQGYIAGALRSGFLKIVSDRSTEAP